MITTTWLLVEWWYAKKPQLVGLLTGAVAGLATITPAAPQKAVPSAMNGMLCAELNIVRAFESAQGWQSRRRVEQTAGGA